MTETAVHVATFQQNIARSLFQTAPHKSFLSSAGSGRLSYGDLAAGTRRAVSYFRSLSLHSDARILLLSKDEATVASLLVAALLEGLTTVIGDCDSRAEETARTLAAAKPDLVVIDQDLLSADLTKILTAHSCHTAVIAANQDAAPTVPFADVRQALSAQPETQPDRHTDPSRTALIVFTSGTTSAPKGVQLTFGNLAAQMTMFETVYKFDAQSHLLCLLPLHHVDGLIRGLLAPLVFGGAVSRPAKLQVSQLPDICRSIEASAISHLILVPTILALIDRLDSSFDTIFQHPAFQFIICSADHLNGDLWTRFENRFKTLIVNSYGLSETVCDSLFCGPGPALRKVGTLGKPVGCDIRLIGTDGAPVTAGDSGEICIRGPHIMAGYFEQPEQTQEVLKDGWFATGDLASLDENGFYHFQGRKKNIIVSGGVNIHPENINTVLLGHASIEQAATFGLDDDTWGQQAIACITLAEGQTLSEIDVVAYCREHLAPEKMPHAIVFLPNLPKVASGKIDMVALKDMASPELQGSSSSSASAAPDVFDIAAACFKLAREELSLDSTPYNTKGWDSLAHLNLITSLEEAFDVGFSPLDIINLNSLEDACDIVGQETEV